MERPKILIFSPSARKVWTDIRKALNPSYFIIAYLAARLADQYDVYTTSSMTPVYRLHHYTGQRIDCVVSLGASYNPGTLKAEFNKGFVQHERAFEVADVTRRVFDKYHPFHVNLCVDVRRWFDSLDMFGPPPDFYMTEQAMKWQQAGYLVNNGLAKPMKLEKFFFSGGVKSRQERFIHLTKGIRLPKTVHGGGWDQYLDEGYNCEGFQPWRVSVIDMLRAKYSLTLHESLGNARGWITAKLFENFGARTVTFVDSEYDRDELYVPKDHILRVSGPTDIQDKIEAYGYDKLLMAQMDLIDPDWGDLENFYVKPFLKKFAEVWDERKK